MSRWSRKGINFCSFRNEGIFAFKEIKIFIFLGGISDVSNKYFDFFKSESTFIPKGTKIYSLSGAPRQMQFMIDYYNYTDPVPGWFNIDSQANLYPEKNNFT